MATITSNGYKYHMNGSWNPTSGYSTGYTHRNTSGETYGSWNRYRMVSRINVTPSPNKRITEFTMTAGLARSRTTSNISLCAHLCTTDPTKYSGKPNNVCATAIAKAQTINISGKDYNLTFEGLNIAQSTTLYVWFYVNQPDETYFDEVYTKASGNIHQVAFSGIKEEYTGYEVQFDANEGNFPQGISTSIWVPSNGSSTTIPGNIIPYRGGYEFQGWSNSKTSNVVAYQPLSSIGSLSANKTLYAVWKAVPVVMWISSNIGRDSTKDGRNVTVNDSTVTTRANGLKLDSAIVLTLLANANGYAYVYNENPGSASTQWLRMGQVVNGTWYWRLSSTGHYQPEKRNYTYVISSQDVGYEASNTQLGTSVTNNTNVIVASQWIAQCYINSEIPVRIMYDTTNHELARPNGLADSYTVTITEKDENGNIINTYPQTFEDTASKIIWGPSLPIPTITEELKGYEFLGYATSATSTTVTYGKNTSGQIPWVRDMNGQELYAIFTKIGRIKTITLNNNGTISTARCNITAQTIYGVGQISGGVKTYTGCTNPSNKLGYEFIGWATSPNSNISVYDSPQAALDNDYTGTLYAVWESTGLYGKIYANGAWKRGIFWIYTNNAWHRVIPWVYTNGSWHRQV